MLDRIADWLLAIPRQRADLAWRRPSQCHARPRNGAMLLIRLAIYTIAFWPFGSIIGRLFRRRSKNGQD